MPFEQGFQGGSVRASSVRTDIALRTVVGLCAYAHPMQRDLRRRAVQLIDAEHFERLVHELLVHARAEDGVKLRKLRPSDYGADTLVLRAGRVEEVIQAKRFTVRPHWGQCEESIDRAVGAWQPSRVTFVFALDFTGDQQNAFNRRIAARYPDVDVDALTLSDIERLLDTHPQVGPRFLGPDARDSRETVERAIRLGGARLDTGEDLLARSEELGRSGDELDPDFVYHQSSAPIEVPESQFEQLPYLSFEKVNERTRVQVSAWAREEDEVGAPWISFGDDSDGREALVRVREGLARGEAVTLTSGFQLSFPDAPRLLKELVADGWTAQAGIIRPGEPVDLEIEAVTPSETVRRSFSLYPVPPKAGGNPSLASSDSALWVELTLEPLEEPQVALHFNAGTRFGTDFSDNAAAAAFMVALIESDHLTFRSHALLPAGEASTSQTLGDEQRRAELALSRDLYGDLALIEKALDVHLDPPQRLSREDLDVIGTVAEILRTGAGTATVGELTNVVPADELARLPELVEGMTRRRRVTYSVLGQDLDLGLAEYAIPPMRIASVRPLGPAPDAAAGVEYRPADTDQAPFHLIDEADSQEPEHVRLPGGAILLG